MPYRRRKKKGFLKWILLIIIPIAIYGWYQYSRYTYILETPVDTTDTSTISFIIKQGESTPEIAKNLLEKDLILDQDIFKLYTKLAGEDRNIVAGRFILSRSMTIPGVVEIITDTRQTELVLTVPEGSTVFEIDNKLVDMDVIEPGQFRTAVQSFDQYEKYPFLNKEKLKDLIYPLEGYLFPDTYFITSTNFYSENLIQLMLQNFQEKIDSEITQIPEDREFYEYIIMASILEKEVRTEEDIPIVSGILWKRLDSGWMIGADATLLYGKDDRELDYADLQEESEYNTRKNAGLPPGPISNPGIAYIKGAINPKESPYWFYLTTMDTGEVIYATTNEEHNENKRKYL